jgi:hypothetical protein
VGTVSCHLADFVTSRFFYRTITLEISVTDTRAHRHTHKHTRTLSCVNTWSQTNEVAFARVHCALQLAHCKLAFRVLNFAAAGNVLNE